MAGIFDTGIFDTGIFDHAAVAVTLPPPTYGGGGAPIWPGALQALFGKKKPKKEDVIEEVAAVIEQAVPQVTEAESEVIAERLYEQLGIKHLKQISTIDALIARVEAELAEMDDEEVLLLAA